MFYLYLSSTSFLSYLQSVKKTHAFPILIKKVCLLLKENKQQEFNTQSDNRLVYKAILQLEMLRFECALFPLLPSPLVDTSVLVTCCNLILWL